MLASFGGPFKHDPQATLDYAVDWSAWLEAVGDTIASVEWTVPAGLVLGEGAKAPAESGGVAVAWLSGGEPGARYSVSCRVTTLEGRVDERTITLQVDQR